MSQHNTLRITEIFHSLQGETERMGLPTVFVRLTGCPLRCQYCDTEYAFTGGEQLSFDNVLQEIQAHQTQLVTVTGGEPLAQKNCLSFLIQLCDAGFDVSLETSGAMDIASVDTRVHIVMDIKTPDSDEADKNHWENLKHLKATDEIKFVICSQDDYEWCKELCEIHALTEKYQVLFSPSFTEINHTELAQWILNDRLDVRYQLQLHKLLWQDAPGH